MRRRTAAFVGACLVGQIGLASTPASAGSPIRAREVVGGLDQPVAFTFGPGKKVWYVEKGTGQVRVHDLDTDADRLFVTVPGVNGDGERGMLGIALHPQYPDKPLVYVYATRSADGQLSNQILRYRDDHGCGVLARSSSRASRAGARTTTAGGSRSGPTACCTRSSATRTTPQRAGHDERGPRQDHPHRARRRRPPRQPVRRPRMGLRDPQLVRLRVRPADRRAVGDGERPVCNDEINLIERRRELRLGTERDLRRLLPRQHEPGRSEPRPPGALLREHDRDHRHRVLRRVPPRTSERGRGVLGRRQQRRDHADRVRRPAGRGREPLGRGRPRQGVPCRSRSGRADGSSSATSTASTSSSASEGTALARHGAGGVRSDRNAVEEPPRGAHRMDIGRPQRIIEVEPVSLPMPEELPDLEPGPPSPLVPNPIRPDSRWHPSGSRPRSRDRSNRSRPGERGPWWARGTARMFGSPRSPATASPGRPGAPQPPPAPATDRTSDPSSIARAASMPSRARRAEADPRPRGPRHRRPVGSGRGARARVPRFLRVPATPATGLLPVLLVVGAASAGGL